MNRELDERIRERAYAIWEQEGQPEGEDFVHWLRAVEDIRAEDGKTAGEGEQRPPTLVAGPDVGAASAPKQSAPADEQHGQATIVAGPDARAHSDPANSASAGNGSLHAASLPGASPAPTAQGTARPGQAGEKPRKLA